jgi:hypothetical protein
MKATEEKESIYFIFEEMKEKGIISNWDVRTITQTEFNALKESEFKNLKLQVLKSGKRIMIFKDIVPVVELDLDVKITTIG